jgi:hypothetical protein
MNTETLLIPRYKIIANYFHSPYEIGDYLENVTNFRFVVTKHCNIQSLASIETLDKMTHLFKKLKWWEERKSEEMPVYLKMKYYIRPCTNNLNNFELKKGQIFIPEKWGLGYFEVSNFKFDIKYAEPATEEEYNNYIRTKV